MRDISFLYSERRLALHRRGQTPSEQRALQGVTGLGLELDAG